jgi:predicted aspartyl protease
MPLLFRKIFSLSTLALITALVLSGIAAWYSVVGLTAIFAAAVIPIIIMGASLEIAKVVTTVWLHRYWDNCKWAMKTYLTGAVIVLALVTSMGIFGFLSKAHMDQGIPTGDVAAQIQLFDDKIAIQKELILSERQNIEAARKTLSQMDAQLTARLDRGDSEASVERAVQIRAQQRRERNSLNSEIAAAQKRIEASNAEIQKINIEKAPIASKYRQIEAEVGPIKYIAALIYGDNPDTATLERAVRWVIILLIFVFDPLALMLVIAAISSYKWEFEKKEEKKIEKFVDTGSDGYLPLDDSEKESRATPVMDPLKEPEPTAANFEMTADGGIVKKEQVNPVKKKLKEKLSLSNLKNLKLPKFDLIKLERLKKLNLEKITKRSNLNLKEKLNWQNLTDWQKSPTLKLFQRLKNKLKK